MIHLHDYEEIEGKDILPCGFRLLVKPLEAKKQIQLQSGVVIHKPDQTVDKEKGGMDIGRVIQVGNDCWSDYSYKWCKIGDYIRFYSYRGAPIKHPVHGDVFILNDTDVLARYVLEGGHDG